MNIKLMTDQDTIGELSDSDDLTVVAIANRRTCAEKQHDTVPSAMARASSDTSTHRVLPCPMRVRHGLDIVCEQFRMYDNATEAN
jgi:hypothetical protein